MSRAFEYRMLIVDDDAVFCEIADQLFSSLGYTVRCAEDGFEALAMMKEAPPDIIICDLNMPRMSGFELLSIVRRRFPQIPIIAMSGEYVGAEWPEGVIADTYLQKGEHSPEVLVSKIRELLEKSPLRANIVKAPTAPVWIPRDGKSYFVLTCTDCLRSFSLPAPAEDGNKRLERTAKCEFCDSNVVYVLDSSLIEQVKRAAE